MIASTKPKMSDDLAKPRTLLAGRKVPANEAMRHAYNAGWKNLDNLITAIAVMYAESDGYEGATHENDNGTIDRGPWQINSIHVDAGRISEADCFRIGPSTLLAYQLYKNRNYSFGAWVAFTNGAYEGKMLEATRGVANGWRFWKKLPFLVEQ